MFHALLPVKVPTRNSRRAIGKPRQAPTVTHMKPNTKAALAAASLLGAVLLGAATNSHASNDVATPTATSTPNDPFAEEKHMIRTVITKAVDIQKAADIPWTYAANLAVSLQPGGGHDIKVIDDIVTYQTDEVCLGGWIAGLNTIKVTTCLYIDWPAYLPD